MKIIVVSAVNLTEGGPLTILVECLRYLNEFVNEDPAYRVIALVHDKSLAYFPNIEYVEIKSAKTSWFKRLYFEYVYFYEYSKKMKPYFWFSLHDISPNIVATKRAVYCHNATPFHKLSWHDLRFNYKVFLFTAFYHLIYRVNIGKNDFVVVQQDWLRKAFCHNFDLDPTKIIVSYPKKESPSFSMAVNDRVDSTYSFFYPSFPRPFKNFELLGDAVSILEKTGGVEFKVYVTLDGSENFYSNWIYKKYKHLNSMVFTGLLNKDGMEQYYSQSDCLIFPSKLESWGLPISEFMVYKRPILAADLPYAHETASGCLLTSFFDVDDSRGLAGKMKLLIDGDVSFLKSSPISKCPAPFTQSWKDLFSVMLK